MLDFDQASCSSIRFVSDYGLDKIRFWSLEGRHRAIVIVSVRSGMLCELLNASSRVIVGRKKKVLRRERCYVNARQVQI